MNFLTEEDLLRLCRQHLDSYRELDLIWQDIRNDYISDNVFSKRRTSFDYNSADYKQMLFALKGDLYTSHGRKIEDLADCNSKGHFNRWYKLLNVDDYTIKITMGEGNFDYIYVYHTYNTGFEIETWAHNTSIDNWDKLLLIAYDMVDILKYIDHYRHNQRDIDVQYMSKNYSLVSKTITTLAKNFNNMVVDVVKYEYDACRILIQPTSGSFNKMYLKQPYSSFNLEQFREDLTHISALFSHNWMQ